MYELISNNERAGTSQKVKNILHMYHIKPYNSEPHHQHQNYAEHCSGHIKMSKAPYSPSQVPPITSSYYVLRMLSTSSTVLSTVVLVIFHLTNICMVKLLIFPPHFVSHSMS